MNNVVNATGSPAAATFNRLQMAALRPEFADQNEELSAGLAAQGITNSGAARYTGGQVGVGQSAALAQAAAPLYQSALNQYGAINEQAPSSDEAAYNAAIQQFYEALGTGAQYAGLAMGMPSGGGGIPSGGTSGGYTGENAPGDPNGQSNTSFIY